MKKIIVFIVFIISFQTITAAPKEKDPVIATVNGVALKQSLFNLHFISKGFPPAENKAEEKKQKLNVANELINIFLLSEEATKKKLEKNKDIQQAIDLARRNILSKAVIQQYMSDYKVTEKAIKKAYSDAVKEAKNKTEYKAKHILLATEKEAKTIIKKLSKGADFGALAKEFSIGPSANKKGDLGWFTPRIMTPAFATAVKKLSKNQFTKKPVKTKFGWHVILVEGIRPFKVPPMRDVKEKLITLIKRQYVQKQVNNLRKKAKVQLPQSSKIQVIPQIIK